MRVYAWFTWGRHTDTHTDRIRFSRRLTQCNAPQDYILGKGNIIKFAIYNHCYDCTAELQIGNKSKDKTLKYNFALIKSALFFCFWPRFYTIYQSVYLKQNQTIIRFYPSLSFSLTSLLSPLGVSSFKDPLLVSWISALNDPLSDLWKQSRIFSGLGGKRIV